VKTAIHTDVSIFRELEPEWNLLVRRSTANLIFCTWEWQSTWWHAYEAGELFVVTCRDEQGRLIGIGPWFIQQVDGERVVRTIGCVDVTDYVDIIADREHTTAVFDAFASVLAREVAQYDRINLCNIPEASPSYSQFPDKLRQHQFDADMILQEVCPVIHLPSEWEGYLAMLDKKQRHEIRRKLRRAESEAALEWVIIDHRHDFDAAVELFLSLVRKSQPAKAEFLNNRRNETFFRRILHVGQRCGWLRLSFLYMDGKPTAAYCDFDYERHILVYNSGLEPELYAHLSPGIVLLAYNIRHAIETGHILYDFLRGNETYKYRMGAHDTRVYKLIARPSEPRATK
jgi:CelD/BcsL family acetyltransferase involved in cellulose biosynthesis